MTTAPTVDPATLIEDFIRDFVERSPENTLQGPFEEKAFETPLVGFSSGDDPLYDSYKQVVGPFHWTPLEIFTQTFPGIRVQPEELTVISWILPQTQATKTVYRTPGLLFILLTRHLRKMYRPLPGGSAVGKRS